MGLEIERKFLVNGDFKSSSYKTFEIAQGYLSSTPERTVRIRIKNDKAFITIKGFSDASGIMRSEWEYEIPLSDAKDMLQLCEQGIIRKRRYLVKVADHTFEVDEFLEENLGLVMAEVELAELNENVELPDWIGKEVTGDKRYYNSYLSRKPYTTW